MIGTLEADDCIKRMTTHSMIGNEYYGFAEECKMLCECSDRDKGVKGYSKYKKRQN